MRVARFVLVTGCLVGLLIYLTLVAEPTGKIDLRILYFGHADSEREADFVSFLETHFKEVASRDFKSFKAEMTRGFDVIIFDYEKGQMKGMPEVPREYARATMTLGEVGADLGSRLGLKTGYL
jgi:hypothetical protein